MKKALIFDCGLIAVYGDDTMEFRMGSSMVEISRQTAKALFDELADPTHGVMQFRSFGQPRDPEVFIEVGKTKAALRIIVQGTSSDLTPEEARALEVLIYGVSYYTRGYSWPVLESKSASSTVVLEVANMLQDVFGMPAEV